MWGGRRQLGGEITSGTLEIPNNLQSNNRAYNLLNDVITTKHKVPSLTVAVENRWGENDCLNE